MPIETKTRIESALEVKAYIQNLNYALDHGAKIQFQIQRRVDEKRNIRYTNRYTIQTLFPNENPTEALKKELRTLTVAEYMRTVQDLRFPRRSEMREFGKQYHGTDDVYIKIRVETLNQFGDSAAFVMSFHFAEKAFTQDMFPYKKTI